MLNRPLLILLGLSSDLSRYEIAGEIPEGVGIRSDVPKAHWRQGQQVRRHEPTATQPVASRNIHFITFHVAMPQLCEDVKGAKLTAIHQWLARGNV